MIELNSLLKLARKIIVHRHRSELIPIPPSRNPQTLNGVPYGDYVTQLGPDPKKWLGQLFQKKSEVDPGKIVRVHMHHNGRVQNIVMLGPELTKQYAMENEATK